MACKKKRSLYAKKKNPAFVLIQSTETAGKRSIDSIEGLFMGKKGKGSWKPMKGLSKSIKKTFKLK